MGLTYKGAGVNIEAGEKTVARIKNQVESTFGPEVLTGLGGFGGLFAPDLTGFEEPVLVAGTDGVGTKLKIAFKMDRHNSVGIDLVAMCVNDILTQGARPLFFLDYLATGKLKPDNVAGIVEGVTAGCRESGCALIGGETAEMPGFYAESEYDMAGFAVGIVDKKKIITGAEIKPGDKIIGLASNGIHSNGYSLVRKIFFEIANYNLQDKINETGNTLGEELLKPTRIYVKPVLKLIEKFPVKGLAHITGGGLVENIPRVLTEGLKVVLRKDSWPVPPVFNLLQRLGKIKEREMYRTFNMGIGMVLFVSEEQVEAVIETAEGLGEKAYLIGEVRTGEKEVEL